MCVCIREERKWGGKGRRSRWAKAEGMERKGKFFFFFFRWRRAYIIYIGPSSSVRNKLCLMKTGRLPKLCPPSPPVIITRPPSASPSSLFSSLLLFLFILIFCLFSPSFSLIPSHVSFSPRPSLILILSSGKRNCNLELWHKSLQSLLSVQSKVLSDCSCSHIFPEKFTFIQDKQGILQQEKRSGISCQPDWDLWTVWLSCDVELRRRCSWKGLADANSPAKNVMFLFGIT